jgi:hypothetical protein
MGGEQLGDIRIMGELLEHQVHGNARPLDDWLASQNPWVGDDSLLVESLIFFHMMSLYHMDAIMRPGASGGDLECPYCGKKGLTAFGLKLHTSRMHKTETAKAVDMEAA